MENRTGKVLCVCGTGNNGGDGLCVVRLLLDKGITAEAVVIGDVSKNSTETAKQLAILKEYGVKVHSHVPDEEYAVIVDALFGIGLSRPVTGIYQAAIEAMNTKNAYRIAVDIPSGIDADTGAVWGVAVRAQETITFGFAKRGLYLYPGASYAGEIKTVDIGISKRSFAGSVPGMYTIKDDPKKLFPDRKPNGNKGTFGKVLLVAGSENMAGAALLCAEAAYRMGAGMVKLVIPEKIREIVQSGLPEALIQVYDGPQGILDADKELFIKNCEWADVIAVGPGLGVNESGKGLLKLSVSQGQKPLVIDADGLNMLAQDAGLMETLKSRTQSGKAVILTPHMGELARLLGKTTAEVVLDETANTVCLAKDTGCIVVGKSARTHVCSVEGGIFLNTAGNDRMAVAGSGDVLTGMIASLLGQGLEPKKAAVTGVYLHAAAGDAAAKEAACGGLLASDMINGISLL